MSYQPSEASNGKLSESEGGGEMDIERLKNETLEERHERIEEERLRIAKESLSNANKSLIRSIISLVVACLVLLHTIFFR